MSNVASWLVGIVAALHAAIGAGEIFAGRWILSTKFGFSAARTEDLETTTRILANAGLYNLFVAAVLTWALARADDHLVVLALAFVIVAGVFGAISLRRPAVIVLQSLPATAALVVLM